MKHWELRWRRAQRRRALKRALKWTALLIAEYAGLGLWVTHNLRLWSF